tara:strand:+ start:528 stop:677 length:150 start_codon:yes stop_codon:yes gene_type:complete
VVHTLDVVFLKPLFHLPQHLVGMVDAALHQSRGIMVTWAPTMSACDRAE